VHTGWLLYKFQSFSSNLCSSDIHLCLPNVFGTDTLRAGFCSSSRLGVAWGCGLTVDAIATVSGGVVGRLVGECDHPLQDRAPLGTWIQAGGVSQIHKSSGRQGVLTLATSLLGEMHCGASQSGRFSQFSSFFSGWELLTIWVGLLKYAQAQADFL
jgi:hypothetical protein